MNKFWSILPLILIITSPATTDRIHLESCKRLLNLLSSALQTPSEALPLSSTHWTYKSLLNPKGRHGKCPLWIDISNCNRTECPVYDDMMVKMTGEFVAEAEAKSLQMEVGVYMWGFRLSYAIPLHRFDACSMLEKSSCPLMKGEKYRIYSTGITKLPFTGSQKVVEVQLFNEASALMLCCKTKINFEKKPKQHHHHHHWNWSFILWLCISTYEFLNVK